MLSKLRSTPVHSTASGVTADTIAGPASNGSLVATDPDLAPAHGSAAAANRSPGSDRKRATQAAASAPDSPDSARGLAASERDEREERRSQRAAARERNGHETGARTGERLHQRQTHPDGPSQRTRLVLGETVSVGLIGIIVLGLIVGAILGALGAPGWGVGLLVATLTVILSAVLRRSPRQN
jgi:hypothetical protein